MGLMTRIRFFALSLALVLGVIGCGGGAGMSRPAGSSAGRIVEMELETLHQFSALEAVRRLRPRWLQTRTGVLPQVHVDGNRVGSAENLNSVRAADVQEMRYLNAADATTQFGTNYVSGVILVTTKR
ncbi:MAG TPA: hypothetical protein VLA36_14965 [Longimicrobiales bacterium]|nr:hypothetical protein [Longimicrobiales bacterium]